MENLSNLISKKVIAYNQGECVGFVVDVCIDSKTYYIKGFLVCDEESENVNFLDIKNVFSISEFIVIKDVTVLEFGEFIDTNNPVGKLVLTLGGDSLGRVKDVQIEGKKVTKLITKTCEIGVKNICDFSGTYLFFSEKRIKKNNIKNNFPKAKNINNKVKIQSNFDKKINDKNNLYQIPFKSSISFADIIGKMATNDVFGMNNEIIIKKDQIITEKIIKKAKKHNKLNILYFSSK